LKTSHDFSSATPEGPAAGPIAGHFAPAKAPVSKGKRSSTPIRVLIADDHDLVRRGLRSILDREPGFVDVCAEAKTGLEALELARKTHPDVAVLDISMPDLNGLEATRLIRKLVPSPEVLILTMHESEAMIQELLVLGARGYVIKSEGARDLPLAIESLAVKRPFFSPRIARKILDGYLNGNGASKGKSPLTPAERRVTQLLAEGKSNKEIANLQGISLKTAETHRASIMRKLGLRSMSDLVHYAVRNSMVEA
jgi:DNA-binding NarL/FixJ family response regulator